jgi:hypothetical protein
MESTEQLSARVGNVRIEDDNRAGDNENVNDATPSKVAAALPPQLSQTPQTSSPDGTWDWTEALCDNDHVRFMKSVNWAETSLGPMRDWPPVLRQATYQVIADSRPATLYWYGRWDSEFAANSHLQSIGAQTTYQFTTRPLHPLLARRIHLLWAQLLSAVSRGDKHSAPRTNLEHLLVSYRPKGCSDAAHLILSETRHDQTCSRDEVLCNLWTLN